MASNRLAELIASWARIAWEPPWASWNLVIDVARWYDCNSWLALEPKYSFNSAGATCPSQGHEG
jgi:hypothetical protein